MIFVGVVIVLKDCLCPQTSTGTTIDGLIRTCHDIFTTPKCSGVLCAGTHLLQLAGNGHGLGVTASAALCRALPTALQPQGRALMPLVALTLPTALLPLVRNHMPCVTTCHLASVWLQLWCYCIAAVRSQCAWDRHSPAATHCRFVRTNLRC